MGKKVWFLFNRKRAERARLVSQGRWPEEGLYGYYALRKLGFETRFSDRGHRIGLFGKASKLIEDFLSEGGKKVGFNIAQAFSLRKELEGADLIFATADSSALGVLALRELGLIRTPVIYSTIGLINSFPDAGSFRARLYRRLMKHAHRIIYYGYEEGELLKKVFGIPDEKLVFIPFCIETSYFSKIGKRENPPISIGLDHLRDWSLLFKAANQVDFEIELICNKDTLKNHSVPENMIFHDPVPMEKLQNKIAGAKFVILPVKQNSYTGATITLQQSMASGACVIVSKTGAIKNGYGLIDNENCMLVEPGNVEDIVKRMKKLYQDPKLCAKIGANAARTAKERYDIKSYAEKLAEIFRETLV